MSLRRVLLAASVGLATLAAAASASAAVALDFSSSNIGTVQTIAIDGYVPGKTNPLTVDPALGATLALTLVSITNVNNEYQWNFDYTISNTSSEASQIGALAWNVVPSGTATSPTHAPTLDSGVIGAANESGNFYTSAGSGNMPMTLGDRDVCLHGANGGCAGGGGAGPVMGASASGSFSLDFLESTTSKVKGQSVTTNYAAPTLVELTDFAVHYQSVGSNGQSTVGEATKIVVPSGPPSPSAVPEPGAWALMLVSFFGLGALLRRQRSQAALQQVSHG